ncbi:MAG: hypothetical protein JRI78_09475 [Deltaproteobacteria bacterium]|nr:hypothetical protein [Deltaproteobacteria bacterium]
MDIKIQLKNLLETGKLYQTQGLLVEAKGKYENALDLIQKTELKDGQKLIDIISKKVSAVNKDIDKIARQPALPELSEEVQDLIKELFTDKKSKDDNVAALEEAITLAKFGQFERALKELNELLNKESVKIDAAKNILRCHMVRTSIKDAVIQFQKWQSSQLFTPNQLLKIRLFLEIFRFDNDEGPLKGGTFILGVSFQIGNVITLFVEGHKEELIESFTVGISLDNVQFNSTIAIFKGKGVVLEKIKIDSGLRQGDYRVDILVTSA